MIKKIILENYRCFDKTEIHFNSLTVIVGKNNAGKSTLIESLRILSVVVNRSKFINYTLPPDWVKQEELLYGISPSIENLNISTANIFHMYGDPPAKITAEFNCGSRVVISIGENAVIFATLANPDGLRVESKKFAASLKLDEINILPQITPIKRTEAVIKFETVQKNIHTSLSSRNFRNQINYFTKDFEKFKELAERSWEGLKIHRGSELERTQGDLFLYVKEGKFDTEIGFTGHGLQMWLQTMWFLSRAAKNSTVILDEPDVYMHADLQRRLIRMIKNEYKQIMVATHSVEIMSEVEPENIMPINSVKPKQQYANKLPIVQKIVNDIGSVHNIEIARIFSHRKFLIVEGEKEDIKLLTIFQSIIFPDTFEPFDILPKTFVEGWGGWQKVLGSKKVFKDNKTSLIIYCLFDSDYHTDVEKEERREQGRKEEINIHIWERKEIENYLLVTSAIFRVIKEKRPSCHVTIEDVKLALNNFCDESKEEIIQNFATEIQDRERSVQLKTAIRQAKDYVEQRWQNEKLNLVSGKTIVSKICFWANEKYKANINRYLIARKINITELSPEMVKIISLIERNEDF